MQLKLTKYTVLFLWLICMPLSATSNEAILSPLPSEVSQKWDNFEIVGQTTLRRFGFHVYDSTFWSTNQSSVDINSDDYLYNATNALSITYARKIPAQKLLTNTKKEWLRLGFADQYPLDEWLMILSKIWPDVNKGDQLIVVTTPGGKSIFYSKYKRLGTIEDTKFGSAFLAIWLDKNSRFKKNRKELLGE